MLCARFGQERNLAAFIIAFFQSCRRASSCVWPRMRCCFSTEKEERRKELAQTPQKETELQLQQKGKADSDRKRERPD
jgi:hypothetical protein